MFKTCDVTTFPVLSDVLDVLNVISKCKNDSQNDKNKTQVVINRNYPLKHSQAHSTLAILCFGVGGVRCTHNALGSRVGLERIFNHTLRVLEAGATSHEKSHQLASSF